MSKHLLFGVSLLYVISMLSDPAVADDSFESLKPNQVIAAFRVEAVYENDAGQAMGARFRHTPSGFVLDLLRIQSVPGAFMWVNSLPPSDKGEPHTCEHLLLGKGNKGRYVASLEDMSLGNSSAFTMQLQTCYHYHTAAGADVFFNLMQAKLDAILHPNFSDEEIRREVCNVGYVADPTDSSLRLEEKGTVYNEMVSSYERPWAALGREMGLLMYGPGHPLSNESGGLPDSIRAMVPEDLWRFHRATHHLNNMGMVVSIPDDITLDDCLQRTSSVLANIEPDAKPGLDPATLGDRLPPPVSAPNGTDRLVDFPHQNENEPGLLVYGWAPTLRLDNDEGYLLDLLVGNLAGGETSNLYRKFIDSQTRVMDIGANAVFGWVNSDLGHPVSIGLNNVKREAINPAMMDSIRGIILGEIQSVADMPDGSAELKSFNERAQGRVIERRRALRKFLNSPPGFGFRGSGADWMEHLKHLQKASGFRKRLTLDSELQFAEGLLATSRNFWREYIPKWGLINRVPYAVAARPSADLIHQTEKARSERIETFIAKLERQDGAKSKDEALRRFKKDYDAKTAAIDNDAKKIPMPRFVSNPPMTLDDQLRFTSSRLPGGGSEVVSAFENMTSATTGLAFRMDVVPESLLLYVAALPTLLTEVGVIKDGRPVAYDEMKEQLRRQILNMSTYYSVNDRTERVELILKASGSDAPESKVALKWLESVLIDPDWRVENLPRIRDAVDQALSGLRNVMRGSEEAWVMDPANAYWRQTNPLILSADCFLTQTHALHRLRWRLKDPGPAGVLEQFRDFNDRLAVLGSQYSRSQLKGTLAALMGNTSATDSVPSGADSLKTGMDALPSSANGLVLEELKDLQQSLADIPDQSLAADWQYLCRQMTADLTVPPQRALDELKSVLNLIRKADNVRVFLISSSPSKKNLSPTLDTLLSRLDQTPSVRQMYDRTPRIVQRLRERLTTMGRPIFVGLVNENTRSGVFINTAGCANFVDFDRESLLKFLSARLYGGGGAHSMFMKTWGAGLAYSNGLRSNESTGRLIYYAERCPDLAQTMQFVVNELKNAPYDTSLAEYAIAQAFATYRSGSAYEERGEAMAADLADGVTPDAVRRFRQGILGLRDSRDLYGDLQARMEYTYGQVLPGYGPKKADVRDAIYFIIGPEKQFQSYEEYLHSTEGDVSLYRLYPRDWWLVK